MSNFNYLDYEGLSLYHRLAQQELSKVSQAKQDKITTFALEGDGASKKIILKAGEQVLGEIDTKDFVVQGMLKSATYDSDNKNLIFTFLTSEGGDEVITINVSDLVDIYTQGNGIKVTDHVISIDENVVSVVGHKHEISDVNGLESELEGKADKVHSHTIDEVTNLQDALDGKADKEHTHKISDIDELQSTLDAKLNIADINAIERDNIYALFQIKVIQPDQVETTEMNDPSENYIVMGGTINDGKTITGNSVTMMGTELASEAATCASLNINSEKVEMENVSLTGEWDKNVGKNSMVCVNGSEDVTIKDLVCDKTGGYNVIEIGLGSGPVKSVVIDGMEVNKAVSNNAVNIFRFDDNAEIVIKNCHFADVSNAFRFSNATYAKNVTITIEDCVVDKWETTDLNYAGLILFQDHTSKTSEEFEEKNPFGSFTVKLKNVTGPNGTITVPADLADVCGSKNENQILYVYANKAGLIDYTTKAKYFPTLVIE